MNSPMMKSLIVIALRHVAPVLGGAGLFSDNEIEQIASALVLLGSFLYHVYKRHEGKKLAGEA